ncbi:MAG: hypothetical protein K6G69_03965 [Lachnospiraceae bacterium]|nr:hypothetical protein [Lachnospiraceae bacterium]
MLSDVSVKKLIRSKEIVLSRYMRFNDGKIEECKEDEEISEKELEEMLYSDRLKLTIGPIIKVLNTKIIPRKQRFNREKNLINLSFSDNKYLLKPGESIIVLTNEYIELSGKYGCLVVPRISLTDVGIVVSPAYIDPFYKGVMRLHISNMSDKTYELKTLEAVAQCFFFELSDTVSTKYLEKFAMKSEYFGLTWKGIMKNGKMPFPTRKKDVDDWRDWFFKNFVIAKNIIKQYGLVIGISLNIGAIISAGIYLNSKLNDYEINVKNIEESYQSYETEITVPADSGIGKNAMQVNIPKSKIAGIICNNDKITYSIESGGETEKCNIIFTYEDRVETLDERVIEFSFVVLKEN